MYVVMAEEERDGHVEQLAICVRFVKANSAVNEFLIELSNLNRCNAQMLSNKC